MSDIYEIHGKAKTVRELLTNQKYSIDYYQREYKWETKHVQELIDDLSNKFLEFYKSGHVRTDVKKYGHYFLGSIIISMKNGQKYIIDGQQRLTTLTLLLIYLNNQQKEHEKLVNIDDMIFSEQYGQLSFNIDVDERETCMESLYKGVLPEINEYSESIRNIIARYEDISNYYPSELRDKTLPFFIDWLRDKVHLVEIKAYSDDDAYTIFETMNDRGLSLSPTDMLKGYLLANITDEKSRNRAAKTWKGWITKFQAISKDDESNFFKTWLRSQYAENIRERKRGAKPGDFDRLGTEFHRWIRDHKDKLGLATSDDFFQFIENEMSFYARWYEKIRQATRKIIPGMEEVFYNARQEFTLQYPVLLATLNPEDDEETIQKKICITATAIEILIVRRIWNFRDISSSTMQYAMFTYMRDIRGKTPVEMADFFIDKIKEDTKPFGSSEFPFGLHGMNRSRIKLILARMTDYVEQKSGMHSRYIDYIWGRRDKRFEVEHIWANHYERHLNEFKHPADFQNMRNRIGALILMPQKFNQSYGDKTYDVKLPHYFGQNLLAKSLHPKCYELNPGFLRFIEESALPFEPHPEFKIEDNEKRQKLYRLIAEQIWDPKKIIELVED